MIKTLRGRVVAATAVILVLMFSVLSYIVLSSLSAYSNQMAENIALRTSEGSAREITANLQTAQAAVNALARNAEYTVNAGTQSRSQMVRYMKDLLSSSSFVSGMWVSFEPNGFDGRDSQSANVPGSDATGHFSPYVVREGNQVAIQKAYSYAEDSSQPYYQIPRANGKLSLIKPYVDVLSGKSTVMVSLAVPLYTADHRFIGVAGVDIDMAVFQQRVQDAKLMGGYSSMVTMDGLVIAHGKDKTTIGKNLKDTDREFLKDIRQVKANASRFMFGTDPSTDQYSMKVCSLIQVPGQSEGWAFVSTISENDLLADYYKVRLELILAMVFIIVFGMAAMFVVISRGLLPLAHVREQLENLKNKGFSQKMDVSRQDEVGKAILAMGDMAGVLDRVFKALQERTITMSRSFSDLRTDVGTAKAAAGQILDTTEEFSNQFHMVVENTRQAVSAIGEIAKGAEDIANAATSAAENSNQTFDQAQTANRKAVNVETNITAMLDASNKAVSSVGLMQEESKKIAEVLNIILEIADQTNLLALNAAIEAARAGEQGRGFAVVAEEIRHLAENTKQSTHTIEALVSAIGERSQDVVDAMSNIDVSNKRNAAEISEMLENIHAIASAIGDINSQVENVAAATEEQTAASQEIAASMHEIESAALGALEALTGLRGQADQMQDFAERTSTTMATAIDVSQQFSYYELLENMAARRQDHEEWMKNMRELKPVQMNPALCKFGQFYYGYQPKIQSLKEIYVQFEAPHRRLHEGGGRVLELSQAGRQAEAAKALEDVEKAFHETGLVFDRFNAHLEELFHQGHMLF